MTRHLPSLSATMRLLLLVMTLALSACASSPQIAGPRGPDAVMPCTRQSVGGFWRCIKTRRTAWLEMRRHHTRAWLGTRGAR